MVQTSRSQLQRREHGCNQKAWTCGPNDIISLRPSNAYMRQKNVPTLEHILNSKVFIQGNVLNDVVCEMAVIWSWTVTNCDHVILCELQGEQISVFTFHFLTSSRDASKRPYIYPWWRHQMETFTTLLALCAGNSPVTGEFPAQRPVRRSFDVFFHLCLNQ